MSYNRLKYLLLLLTFCEWPAGFIGCGLAQTNIFSITNAWRYQQTTNLDGAGWQLPAYDDSGWPSGPGLLYSETNALVSPRNTPLNQGRTTYYFRTHFDYSGDPTGVSLTFSNLIDDGAVFYLNGVEIHRVRMAAAPAPIAYTNFATGSLAAGDATIYDVFTVCGEIATSLLVSGDNVLAAEVHQVNGTSSDIVFGSALSVIVPDPSALVLVPFCSIWKYLDNGSDQGAAWRNVTFDDTGWASGPAQLGYGDGDEATVVNGGPATNRFITTYFRRAFTAAEPSIIRTLSLRLVRDDGCVVYLNGTEIFRSNMPPGPIASTTPASGTVGGDAETALFTYAILNSGLLSAGTNILAAEIHQVNSTSSDTSFELELIGQTNEPTASVSRGPYLQAGSHTNIVVRWRTTIGSDSQVLYGTNLTSLELSEVDIAARSEHEIALNGLTPNTRYFYAIGTTTNMLAGGDTNFTFVTSPVPGASKTTRIWVIGDAGRADANQAAVRDAYNTFAGSRHTDLWLMLGDNAYNDGTDAEYQAAVFDLYPDLLRQSVVWPALGNHDTAQLTGFTNNHPYFDMFTLPKNGEAGGVASGTEHYYSFNYGNLHFVCLDSMTADRSTNGAMANWLRDDLDDTTNTWIIAFWHHPPYTKGTHNSDTEIELIQMRENFLPLLEAGGVDLVLTGHSHVYERSVLLDGHYGFSTNLAPAMILDAGSGRENDSGAYEKPAGNGAHRGAVYAVVGCSGQTGFGSLDHPAMYVSLNNLGSLVLDVDGNRLDAWFIRETGATNDYFTITKTNYPPVASNLTVTVYADGSTNLTLAGHSAGGNSLTFTTDSLPTRGLLSSFNPTNGLVVYTPAHGYSGADSFLYRVSDGFAESSAASVNIAILPLADANTNGIPDAWEATYGISNSEDDSDNDGLTNLQEYVANTNPTNDASTLRITSAGYDLFGNFIMTWISVGGTRYRVHYSDGNANSGYNGVFTDIARPVTEEMDPSPIGSASTRGFIDDLTLTGGPPPQGDRFYRIEVLP